MPERLAVFVWRRECANSKMDAFDPLPEPCASVLNEN